MSMRTAASVAAMCVEMAVLLVVQIRDRFDVLKASARDIVALWRLGWPTGAQFVMEMASFTVLSAMVSKFSETHMAAHQIALQVIHFSFLPAVAFGEAASVLVGQSVGAKRLDLVRPVSRMAMKIVGIYTGLWTVLLIVGGRAIASGFTQDASLIQVTTNLFLVAAVFQVTDGANIVSRAALRGTGDVRFPAVVGIVASWLATPPAMLVLGYWMGMGVVGGWIGLCCELIILAGVLWWRLESNAWHHAAARTREIRGSLRSFLVNSDA